ncbi:MAG: fructose bisphosphate aldolase [Candidatus Peregrinibacteria bacterium]
MSSLQPIERIRGNGFIAALDQSGGSTPKALNAYGIDQNRWKSDEQMHQLVHEMRERIITSDAFDKRISGAILFERTMENKVQGVPTAQFLWEQKSIVPFLKIDDGLQPKSDEVELMKPIAGLDKRLQSAVEHGVFGTKMRSVIHGPNQQGIQRIVDQQFAVAQQIQNSNLMPIIEPEVSIKAQNKVRAEELLREQLQKHLDQLPDKQQVMLKLTLPEQSNFYDQLIKHPRVLRAVALSGGYSRADANKRLAANNGMTASFSRALVEDLKIDQSDQEFTAALNAAIQSIYDAAIT